MYYFDNINLNSNINNLNTNTFNSFDDYLNDGFKDLIKNQDLKFEDTIGTCHSDSESRKNIGNEMVRSDISNRSQGSFNDSEYTSTNFKKNDDFSGQNIPSDNLLRLSELNSSQDLSTSNFSGARNQNLRNINGQDYLNSDNVNFQDLRLSHSDTDIIHPDSINHDVRNFDGSRNYSQFNNFKNHDVIAHNQLESNSSNFDLNRLQSYSYDKQNNFYSSKNFDLLNNNSNFNANPNLVNQSTSFIYPNYNYDLINSNLAQTNFSVPSSLQSVPTMNNFSNLSTNLSTPDIDNNNNNNIKIDNSHSGEFSYKKYQIVRGISAGGCNSRPPKNLNSSSRYYLTELNINGASIQDICLPYWSNAEKLDKRRIVRIERMQQGPKLIVNFSIIGSAEENPIITPSKPGVEVVEVSCLECQMNSYDSPDEDSQSPFPNQEYQYYITSVELIEIVELLIGSQSKDPMIRRKERGRVRSNLVPFWSKKPISSRMNDSPKSLNNDPKLDLAKRIMGYEIRKPRGFDKEVRILRWDKLVPALKRALQSYYTEIPLE